MASDEETSKMSALTGVAISVEDPPLTKPPGTPNRQRLQRVALIASALALLSVAAVTLAMGPPPPEEPGNRRKLAQRLWWTRNKMWRRRHDEYDSW